jgi:hypothetical protein
MRPILKGFGGGVAVALLVTAGLAAAVVARRPISIPQNVDQATLEHYHATDQGTRIMPAAFLASLRTEDGRRLMDPEQMGRWGFLVDGVPTNAANPYGWPLGFTVSDPKVTDGIPVAGVTCALCHTGEVDYRGAAVRIEGGQSYVDLPAFQRSVFKSIGATAADPARRAAFLKDAVAAGYPADRVEADFKVMVANAGDILFGQKGLTGTSPGPGRVDAVQGIANAVFGTFLHVTSNNRDYDAPVNYPYLWDIWRLSWLQYNGFLPPNSDSRNIGEVLGTSGKADIVDPVTGALNPVPQRWRTSVQIKNLIWLESVLKRLKAPAWPAQVLGPIDSARAERGRVLFTQDCASCHGIHELPNGEWDVHIVPLSYIGTDPNQATNWAGRAYDASKLGLGTVHATALGGLINTIRKQLYADAAIPASEQQGDVTMMAPCGYKARPLIGVWATPPFLHNGSVRTVFDLLSDTRPKSFRYGSREYDPVHLGYTEDDSANPAVLDTALSGNSNAGHWWTDDTARPGRIGPRLSDAQKYAIIEFLKAATYENYPKVKVATMHPVACADNPGWAGSVASR